MAKKKKCSSGDYKVGFRRPPVKNQFKKGVSGNPGGRPPGQNSLYATLRALGDSPVTAKVNGVPTEMTLFEAMARRHFELALNGNLRAIEYICAVYERGERLAIQSAEQLPVKFRLVLEEEESKN